MGAANDLTIRQGSTFALTVKYGQPHLAVKAITDITKSGQAVVTAISHGIPLNWPVWVVGVGGMSKINHRADELHVQSAAYYAYYVSTDVVRLDLDTTRYGSYTSGGELLYNPPVDLTSYTARMHIRESITDTTVLSSLTTENGGITLGGVSGSIALSIPAVDTAAFTFDCAVYDLEVIDPAGIVTLVMYGAVELLKEVTR